MVKKQNQVKKAANKSSGKGKTDVKPQKKLFVLDTNIPLQDPNCLFGFKEHDVCIPITVLEELDRFKKGFESTNLNARMFLRSLEKIITSPETAKGAKLGKGLGKLSIGLPGREYPAKIATSLMMDIPDHRILAIAYKLQQNRKSEVVLVTNDINLRVKAMRFGVSSESYRNESVQDMDKIYKAIREVKLSNDDWDNLFSSHRSDNCYVAPESLRTSIQNQLYILRSEGSDEKILARVKGKRLTILDRSKLKTCLLTPRNDEQYFALNALLDPSITLVALTGKAGTGKTLVALAAALKQKKDFEEILVSRPAIEVEDKTLGFLPGDINEKLDPYMAPIYDNLDVLREAQKQNEMERKERRSSDQKSNDTVPKMPIKDWAESQGIKVLGLNYVRGRSLAKKFIIVDEAQNLSHLGIKTLITRAGEGTKIVIIGDVTQIDSPYQNEKTNGLSHVIDRMKGQPEFVHVHLTKGERSALADKAGRLL